MNDPSMLLVKSHSVEETLELGRCLGAVLSGGAVVALVGGLGSGKTHFVKGVARGNNTPPEVQVTSPTFVLVNEYPGRLHLFHVDVYRLGGAGELEAIGFDEMLGSGGAVLVEWADRVPECLPPDHLRLEIEITGETDRRFTVSATGSSSRAILASLET